MHHLVQDELQAKHRRSRSQPEYHGRSFSRRKKKSDDSKTYYYSDSPRTPSPLGYKLNKASILRLQKHQKPDESMMNEEDDLAEVMGYPTRKSTLRHHRHHSSLNDLSSHSTHHHHSRSHSHAEENHSDQEKVPYSKNNSVVLKRQNSEPLVGMSI